MRKLLISTVVWCPPGQPARVETICRHLGQLAAMKATHGFVDIHVVDNDVSEPRILAAMEGLGVVERFSPQRGWARGRNLGMKFFQGHGQYVRLALADCDQYWDDLDWPAKVMALADSDPDLHAFMIRVDKRERRQTAPLPSGTIVDVYAEWYGSTNVVSRAVLEKVGALNTDDFPQDWGFHDCEWGRRLRAAGVLESSRGCFVDPIRISGSLGHDDAYDASMASLKSKCIGEYLQVFRERERDILAGKQIFMSLEGAT